MVLSPVKTSLPLHDLTKSEYPLAKCFFVSRRSEADYKNASANDLHQQAFLQNEKSSHLKVGKNMNISHN